MTDLDKTVREFHKVFNAPIGSTINPLTEDRRDIRIEFIESELVELMQASANADIPEMADALGDIIYTAVGMLVEMGINVNVVMDEIHASNMTKLGEDGKPILNAVGKVMKGPNYRKPDLKGILLGESKQSDMFGTCNTVVIGDEYICNDCGRRWGIDEGDGSPCKTG